MKHSKQLTKRFTDLFLDGKWIANTNYREQLTAISFEVAIKQIEDLNTIAKLTYHINYYLKGILNVFNGGDLEIRDKYSFDLPVMITETDWENLVNELIRNATIFAEHIEAMSIEKLESPFVDEKYGSYRRNIEGVIEHSYYHLGQIVLIRKLV